MSHRLTASYNTLQYNIFYYRRQTAAKVTYKSTIV